MSSSIEKILKPVLWDYDIDALDFYHVAVGEKEHIGSFDQQRALVRIFERLDWYDILDVFGIEFVEKHLTVKITSRLRFADLRKRYDTIRRILHGEPVSFAGWSVETAERAKNAVLSNRWYSTEPALL
ncbi:hypothetical protein JXA70_06425 [candidate division KSB1 bacterium]|nr:hypothetical protein [candidate division KSB1 bacterium]